MTLMKADKTKKSAKLIKIATALNVEKEIYRMIG